MRWILLLLLAIVAPKSNVASKVGCKDQQGQDVDWWHMYLLNYERSNEGHREYYFVTSNDNDNWKKPNHFLDSYESLTSQTLNPLYDNDNIMLAAYNDVFPNLTLFEEGGAAKGVIASDGESGMWLVHSIPGYPAIKDRWNTFPNVEEVRHAQNLYCLTLNAEGVDKVGQMLLHYEPHFYYQRNPLGEDMFPNLQRALNGNWLTDGIYEKEVGLRTSNDEEIRIFGRSPMSYKELYSEIVSPALQSNLFVAFRKFYLREDHLPSVCHGTYKIYNIKSVDLTKTYHTIYSTSDESKWAVTEKKGFSLAFWRLFANDWICIGDLDRRPKHKIRGGGAICHKSATVSDLYRGIIYDPSKC